MCASLKCMQEGCHPFIFYHRVRPFLSGWKQNPALPFGVLYEGVSPYKQQFYGGSAAQSSLLPFLDIGLGISHENIRLVHNCNPSLDFEFAGRRISFLLCEITWSNLTESFWFMLRSVSLRVRLYSRNYQKVANIREFVINTLLKNGFATFSNGKLVKEADVAIDEVDWFLLNLKFSNFKLFIELAEAPELLQCVSWQVAGHKVCFCCRN